MTDEQTEAFSTLFALADNPYTHSGEAARALLGAFWNVGSCGPLDPTLLWSLDAGNLRAARTAILFWLDRESLVGTAFDARMRALAGKIVDARTASRKEK